MSDTPETDEQINGKPCTRFQVYVGDSLRDAWVPSEFARKLERERDEARLQYRSTHALAEALAKTQVELKAERDEARKQLEALK